MQVRHSYLWLKNAFKYDASYNTVQVLYCVKFNYMSVSELMYFI